VATSVLAFALITTGGLHWFTKPYVHQMLYNKQVRRPAAAAEQLNSLVACELS
jgi:hypothetical protein